MRIRSTLWSSSAKLILVKHQTGIWYDPVTESDTYKYTTGSIQNEYRFNDLNCEYWNVYIRRGDLKI